MLLAGTLAFTGCGGGASGTEKIQPANQARSVINGPDLVITRIQAPSSLMNRSPFTAKVTVCNTGPAPTTSLYHSLRLYLSTGPTQQFPPQSGPAPTGQIEAGRTNVARLVAGECVTQDVPALALWPSPGGDGAYFLGAFIDVDRQEAEQDENNNGFVSGRMGVGFRPDLVVTRLDAPVNLIPDAPFIATATVCNEGPMIADASSVELYLSTVDTLVLPSSGPGEPLPLEQSSLGTTPTPSLYPGECFEALVAAQATLPLAGYWDQQLYLGAAVNPTLTLQELRQDNNLFVSGRVGVGIQPDLIVRSVTAPPGMRPGEAFTPSVQVCNVGTSDSSPSDVAVFMSTVPSLSAPPVTPAATHAQVGTQSIPALESGRCATVPVAATAQLPQAATADQPLYVGAVVDPSNWWQELSKDNNTLAVNLMGVGLRPDLELTAIEAPASLEPGLAFSARAKVCNVGTQPSLPSQVRLFLATTPTLGTPSSSATATQAPLTTESVPALNPGECSTRRINASATLPSGASDPNPVVYLAAAVDPQATLLELREDNNARVWGRVGVGHEPDLVITNLTGPSSALPFAPMALSVRVCNVGTANTYPAYVPFFLSTTATLPMPRVVGFPQSPTRSFSGAAYVMELTPGQCMTVTPQQALANVPPSALPGQPLYLGAIVEPWQQQPELRADNNPFVAGRIDVGTGPDWVVTAVSGPSHLRTFQPGPMSATVCNAGTAATSGGQLELLLTTDPDVPAPSASGPGNLDPGSAVSYGTTSLPTLQAGECRTVSVPGPAYLTAVPYNTFTFPDLPLRVAARVASTQELRSDNNTFLGARISTGNGVDLVVRDLSAPIVASQAAPFSPQVTVCNEGFGPSYMPTPVQVILSTEATPLLPTHGLPFTPTPLQTVIGQTQVPGLGAGECITTPVLSFASRPTGAYADQVLYLSAFVAPDGSGPYGPDLRSDNDSLTGNVFVLLPY